MPRGWNYPTGFLKNVKEILQGLQREDIAKTTLLAGIQAGMTGVLRKFIPLVQLPPGDLGIASRRSEPQNQVIVISGGFRQGFISQFLVERL